jgi:hypothetical protein
MSSPADACTAGFFLAVPGYSCTTFIFLSFDEMPGENPANPFS